MEELIELKKLDPHSVFGDYKQRVTMGILISVDKKVLKPAMPLGALGLSICVYEGKVWGVWGINPPRAIVSEGSLSLNRSPQGSGSE